MIRSKTAYERTAPRGFTDAEAAGNISADMALEENMRYWNGGYGWKQ
ncbi:MAG: hypothetical protein HFI10_03370 [Lachnospiraceae bacterium]|nr:hypothetical protein [Lachnospiraceae bacterium]